MQMSNNILYPSVTSLPGSTGVQPDRKGEKAEGAKGEFDQIFDKQLKSAGEPSSKEKTDLNQIRNPLKFSAHATQRLAERKIALDPATMAKVNAAVDKADSKGVEDTLVLTKDAALIVNVKNRTVVTAMDRGSLDGNVFTNIDGAVIV
jgi:flagellar operon protein